jgi:cell division protein FtsI/penicillin-binding protein 2
MTAKQQYHNRIYVVIAVLSTIALILVFRLVRWQIMDHQFFVDLANQQNQKEIILKPSRGNIYDSNNHLLAGNAIQYEVSASPQLISDPYQTTDRLYRLLNIPRETLLQALTSDRVWIPLTRTAPREVGETLLEWDISGIVVTPHSKRAYPEGELAAHLLGFVNDNNNGFYGIEGYYDNLLRGSPGRQTGEHGPFGDLIPMGDFQITPPTEGADLYLTIDRIIQQMAEEELLYALNTYGAESGSIVVLNPKTGALLASANWPTYNPNHFGETDTAYFLDALVSKPYEPGSVFKIVTMAAALDSNTIAPGTTVYDGGIIEVGGQTIYNADKVAYGTVDMTTVLAKSLNVGTAQIAMAMGEEKFYNYVRRFGLGRLTEIDLSGETQGTLKTPHDTGWYESALATNSFGQGLAVTPIQMTAAVAAVANNGLLMKPYVIQKVISHDTGRVMEFTPQVVRRAVSADTANILTQMLATALEKEHSPALIPGYKVAGKTGTAEIPIPGGYHPYLTITSFGGFFPADDPQVVILVILNKPTVSKWGNKTAAPTFKRIGERIISLLDIPPDDIRLAQK